MYLLLRVAMMVLESDGYNGGHLRAPRLDHGPQRRLFTREVLPSLGKAYIKKD
jgi:hypothetical protein